MNPWIILSCALAIVSTAAFAFLGYCAHLLGRVVRALELERQR